MFCEKCGAELPQEAAFCPKCGAEQKKSEIKKIHFDLSDKEIIIESKSKKGPVFFLAGLVSVLVVAIIVLVYSIFGKKDAKKVVEAAMQKTIQTLQEEGKEKTEDKKFGYSFEITGKYSPDSDQENEIGEILEEFGLEDFRIFLYGNLYEEEKDTYGSIEFGTGDMKNIRLNCTTEEAGSYLYLPDLYDRSFFVPKEFIEDTTGADVEGIYDQEAREEVLLSLKETLYDVYQELYTKAEYAKIGKETLTESGMIQTTCYEMTILASDYESYLNSLPDRLEENTVFIDWLAEVFSRQWVDGLLDSLREDIADYKIPNDVDLIILGNLYLDQQGRVVQIRIPYEEETGELVVSFLGEEKLSDYISIRFGTDDGYNVQTAAFLYQVWDESRMQSIVVDKKNSIVIGDDIDELEEALVEILCNVSDGGYVPSQYADDFDEFLLSLLTYEDYGEDYDWRHDLDYSDAGNPILEDYGGKYQIELIAPPNASLDLNWSYPVQICFMDEGEDQDYYYEVVEFSDDTVDRFDFERTYMSEENGYKNVVFSDIMQKEINGYLVNYQYYSYEYNLYDGSVVGYKTYYAWVRLNETDVFELCLNDYTNSVEDDILDGCFEAVLPIE